MRRALPLDGAVVPALLLAIARDLILHDPPRVLAWRVLHDERLAAWPSWLRFALPQPPPGLDRDPGALLLGAFALACATLYLAASLLGARARVRAAVLAVAACGVVLIPTLLLAAMGLVSDRPHGQDGGVVQLPLALDKLLAGQSPYGADYSDSILGKQARVSDFWAPFGGNPILHHHAYLPGTHAVMLPFYLLGRAAGAFDTRFVTLLAWAAAALLAARLVEGTERRLCAAAAVLVGPLLYWQQIFGANDIVVVALLLASVALAARGRPDASAAVLGFACATKQLAWPFAPFLLLWLSGATSFRALVGRPVLPSLLRAMAVASAVFAVVVLPVAALDPRAFWGDIVVYNVGLPGADNYPLGGTPGFGFANVLIYFGRVATLRDYVPFSRFYMLLVPLGLLLARAQLRAQSLAAVFVHGSVALLASLYFSRVVHANYLILAAVLLPLALLMGARIAVDAVIVPLGLLALAVEVGESEMLRGVWEDAVAVRVPAFATGLARILLPRAGPGLTLDPLGLLWSATAAGLALALLTAGALGARARVRLGIVALALVALVVVPTSFVMAVGRVTGAPRAQDAWLATAYSAAPGSQGPTQAWSTSFRRDPPTPLRDVPAATAPGQLALSYLASDADPRHLLLFAMAVAALLLALLARASEEPLVTGALLLSPAAIVGVCFGAGDVLLLALLLVAALQWRRGRMAGAGFACGVGVALFPRLLFALPLLLPLAGPRVRRASIGAALGALWFVLPSIALAGGVRAFLAVCWPVGRVVPGLGLANLFLYRGLDSAWLASLGSLLPALVVAAAAFAAWRWRPAVAATPAWASLAMLAGLWLAPGSSPHDLVVPLAGLLASSLVDTAPAHP
jgi:hypothetical protein